MYILHYETTNDKFKEWFISLKSSLLIEQLNIWVLGYKWPGINIAIKQKAGTSALAFGITGHLSYLYVGLFIQILLKRQPRKPHPKFHFNIPLKMKLGIIFKCIDSVLIIAMKRMKQILSCFVSTGSFIKTLNLLIRSCLIS